VNAAPPPAAVLDTNVVLDWLVFRDAGVTPIVDALAGGALRWLATPRMQAEFDAVLRRGHLDRWGVDRERLLARYALQTQLCEEPPPSRLVCTDPDDQVFIDLAVAQRCAWLFTKDRALLKLGARARAHGVRVVPPARWPG
jgi:predicted nucleic acid-binding protein